MTDYDGPLFSFNYSTAAVAPYSTSFSNAQNPLSESGVWICGKAVGGLWNDPLAAGGNAVASVNSGLGASRYDDCIAHLNPSTNPVGASQFAQATAYKAGGYTTNGSHEIELLLRFSITANNARGYEILWSIDNALVCVRWNGPRGDYDVIHNFGTVTGPATGSTLRAEISGDILKVFINGSQVGPNVNVRTAIGGTVWDTGQPGIGFWPVDGAIAGNMGWSDWTGGNLSAAPSWATALALNAWTALSDTNSFNTVRAANVGQGDSQGVFNAWNGAALLSSYGAYGSILHWGGGHADYYGNEVYRYDLGTLTWTKLNNPSSSGGYTSNQTDGLRPDGTPGAAHTYYYINGKGSELIITKRQASDSGPVNYRKVSRFNANTLTWTNSAADSGLDASPNTGTCYDASRDCLWSVQNSPFDWAKYSLATDTWTLYSIPGNDDYATGPVYVPSKDCVVHFTVQGKYGLDCVNPASARISLIQSGTPPSMGVGSMLCWSSNLGAVVCYPNASSSIYLLTPPPSGDWRTGTWVWTQKTLSGSSGTHSTAGTYGKFQVVEWGATTVAVVVDDVGSAHRAVRLS